MQIQRFYRFGLLNWAPRLYRRLSMLNTNGPAKLCKYFDVNQDKAEYICLKQPYVNKLDEVSFQNIIETVQSLGFAKEVLIQDPMMFSIMPTTIRFRYKVLEECGFKNITPEHLTSYLPLMKQKTIGELKRLGIILADINVEHRLNGFLTQWPISLSNLNYEDNQDSTLYNLRLKILQRYLELVLDLTEDEFYRGIKLYPTIKHRPLEVINETLNILQAVVMIPNKKIKTNLYLIHVDPENLKQVIYNFRTIGGIDVKEILRLHPKLATKRYDTMVEIKNVLQEYGISDEAQRRCFDIYTLSPGTIRSRLEEAKQIPEFKTFLNHPRFLKMIHYKNTAMNRLKSLHNNRKQCMSLNILSGSSAHYKIYENSPGDRLGKGKDLIFCISESLRDFNSKKVWNMLKRHQFWCMVPLIQVKHVYQQLSMDFEDQDIYENCAILLYPWSNIKNILDIFDGFTTETIHELDVTKLSKSQKLSLVLYYLERNHYFTGNGIWSEEKSKNIEESTDCKDLKYKQVCR